MINNAKTLLSTFIVLTFQMSAHLQAAPAISSASGGSENLLSNVAITITGTGFGEPTAKPILYDMVDNKTIYESIASGTEVTVQNSPWNEVSEYIYSRTPPKIVKEGDLRYPEAVATYEGAVSFVGKPDGLSNINASKIYVSWYFRPSNEIGANEANKFIRIWDRLDGEGLRLSWTSMHMTYPVVDLDYIPPTSWGSTLPTPNVWSHFEIYANAEKGTIEAKVNGSVKHQVTDFRKSNSPNGLTIGLIGFDPVDNNKYATTKFRFKDIYVSTSQARIEISESKTWDPKSKREILSFTTWTNTKIEANFNSAADALSEKYIYVIDENGNVNSQGFPLECDQCPAPPKSVIVN